MCKENEEFQADFDDCLVDLYDEQIDDDYMAVDGHFNALCCRFSLPYYYNANKVPSVTIDAKDGPPAHDAYGMHAGHIEEFESHLWEQHYNDPDDPDEALKSQRAKQYSKWDNVIKPTTLCYYPIYWQEVLNCSKKKMQCYSHSQDVDVLVFQEASTYRGVLKTLGHDIVGSKYSDALSVLDCEEENQEGLYQQVAANVQALLNDKLVIKFYYTGNNALAHTFPEDFEEEVPMYNCLEEWLSGIHEKCSFKGKTYSSIHNTMVDITEEVLFNEYHGAKFNEHCHKWAQKGM
ncbi:hypothetical protein L208DRAFT_1378844 [Tricholoma matsutake]|nr:hypothetical protein L208DRAFT_1378844 [Tricholoma matsutake 945]